MTESGALALTGWLLGLVAAGLAIAAVQGLRPASLEMLDVVSLTPGLAATSLGVSVATALVVGIGPALFASSRRLADDLRRESTASTADRRASRWRGGLVLVEVALSVTLLVGAGLLVRTLVGMQQATVGFQADVLYTAELVLPDRFDTSERRRAALDDLGRRFAALPRVEAVTWASSPPDRPGVSVGTFEIEGEARLEEGRTFIGFVVAPSDYFGVLGIEVREGRIYDDRALTDEDIVINEGFARRNFPDGAVGRRLRLMEGGPWSRVVGVVADVRLPSVGGALGATGRVVYQRFEAFKEDAHVILRGRFEGQPLLAMLAREAAAVDSAIRIRGAGPMSDAVVRALELPRFIGTLLVVFAGVAVTLAAVGLYGVVSFTVTRRRHEIGIRIALGAEPPAVLRTVAGHGLALSGAGLVIGLFVAAMAADALRGLLYQVEPLDAPSFVAAGLVLGVVAAAAVLVPARRATHVDPVNVLRQE